MNKGLLLALTTAVLWGVLPLALIVVLRDVDAYTVTWYRFVIAGSILLCIHAAGGSLPRVGRLGSKAWRLVVIAVAGLSGNYVLFLIGLHHTSPTLTQTVSQLGPIFLLLGGVLVFHERLLRIQKIGAVVLIAGLALFFNRRLPELLQLTSGTGLGVMLVVLGSVAWPFYGLSQKQLQAYLAPQQILLIVYLGAALVLLPLASPAEARVLPPTSVVLLIFCGVNTVIAYGAFAESLKHWEVSRVGAVLATTPLWTLITMWIAGLVAPGFVEPEKLNAASVAGALIVVAGSALVALGRR